MEWLAIAGLIVWIILLMNRIGRLEQAVRRPTSTAQPLPSPAAPPLAPPWPSPAPSPASTPSVQEAVLAAATAPVVVRPATPVEIAPPPPRPPRLARQPLDRWMAENGLAWVGGGALVLGAAFLVGYAVREGVFTPDRRVWAGAALGVLLLTASEALRRLPASHRLSHPLAAAIAAGAGAAALYAATWAAYALYDMIGAPTAAAMLAAVAGLLLAMSFRHGQPLAALAMAGALAAPAATGADSWRFEALALYMTAAVVAGYAVARTRRWDQVAAITLLGGLAWAALALADASPWRAAGLIALTVAGAVAVVAGREALAGDDGWAAARRRLALAALFSGCVVALPLGIPLEPLAAGGLIVTVLIALAGVAVWFRVAPASVLAAPAVLAAMSSFARANADLVMFEAAGWMVLWAGALIGVGGLAGRRSADWRADAAGAAGALGVIVSLALLVVGQAPTMAAGAAAGATLALFAAGWARSLPAGDGALAADLWGGAAAGATLTALFTAFAPASEPAACAVAALGFAGLGRATGWRVWPAAALVASGLAIASLFQPAVFVPAVDGRTPAWEIALFSGAASAALFAATFALRRWRAAEETWQGVLTAAIVAALTGAFLLLRRAAGGGEALDALTEAALQTVLLLTAGLLSARFALGTGWVARLRTHALLGGGVAWGLWHAGPWLNPWWGWINPLAAGPPLLDSITLAMLAPAILAALASARFYPTDRPIGRAYAWPAAGFLLLFATTEVRRLFHAPELDIGPIGALEGQLYGLIALVLPWAAAEMARLRPGLAQGEVATAARRLTWAGIAFALAAGWLIWNPWWGWASRPLSGPADAFGIALTLLAVAAVALRIAGRERVGLLRDAALATSVAHLLLLLTLAIRFGFQGADMTGDLDQATVETWAYSASWAVFGVAVLAMGAQRGDALLRRAGLVVLLAATLKVFLFDMSALQGVLRAASFLGLGVVLLAGAVAARRLGVLETGPHEPR